MEKIDKTEVMFHVGMYVFMLSAAGAIAYETYNLSNILLGAMTGK